MHYPSHIRQRRCGAGVRNQASKLVSKASPRRASPGVGSLPSCCRESSRSRPTRFDFLPSSSLDQPLFSAGLALRPAGPLLPLAPCSMPAWRSGACAAACWPREGAGSAPAPACTGCCWRRCCLGSTPCSRRCTRGPPGSAPFGSGLRGGCCCSSRWGGAAAPTPSRGRLAAGRPSAASSHWLPGCGRRGCCCCRPCCCREGTGC